MSDTTVTNPAAPALPSWAQDMRNLFRSGASATAAPAEAVEYKGYRITPAPERQPSGWNTAGLIA